MKKYALILALVFFTPLINVAAYADNLSNEIFEAIPKDKLRSLCGPANKRERREVLITNTQKFTGTGIDEDTARAAARGAGRRWAGYCRRLRRG